MNLLADLLICLRFFSRVPVPATAREIELGGSGLAAAATMVPVAGALIGLLQAGVLLAGSRAGLSFTVVASLVVAAGVAVTGALHEDALADCADGFGGGRSREHKLAIMRDSRVGAFGATTVVLSLVLRIASLATIAGRSLVEGAVALVFAAALSRAACLVPLVLLPPARPEGLGAEAVRTAIRPAAACGAAALTLALGAIAADRIAGGRVALALALAIAATLATSALAWRQIGGHTGDVAGTVQQVAEIVALVVLSAAP